MTVADIRSALDTYAPDTPVVVAYYGDGGTQYRRVDSHAAASGCGHPVRFTPHDGTDPVWAAVLDTGVKGTVEVVRQTIDIGTKVRIEGGGTGTVDDYYLTGPSDTRPYGVGYDDGGYGWHSADDLTPYAPLAFSVGDRVRITVDLGNLDADTVVPVGTLGTVDHVDEDDPILPYRIDFDGPYRMRWICARHVEAAPPEPRFKVGDRVRLLYHVWKGSTGTVVAMLSEFYDVMVQVDGYSGPHGGVPFTADEVAPLTEVDDLLATTTPAPTFSVGDHVRLTKDAPYLPGSAGITGTVIDADANFGDGSRPCVLIDVSATDSVGEEVYAYVDEIEAATAPEPPAIYVGDRVRIIGPSNIGHRVPIGTLGTVLGTVTMSSPGSDMLWVDTDSGPNLYYPPTSLELVDCVPEDVNPEEALYAAARQAAEAMDLGAYGVSGARGRLSMNVYRILAGGEPQR